MKIIYCLLFLTLTLHLTLNAQTLEEQLGESIDIVVDIAGNGDYQSISEALNAVPDNSTSGTIMFIRNGKYLEKVEIPSTKKNLTIVGQDIDKTVISYDDYSGSGEIYNGILNYKGQEIGTSTSHTLYIAPENFLLLNLTVENSAGRVGQAVAINLHGDRQTLAYCRILGNQDTFYTWGDGRFYIVNSYIEGNVDFIFGRGVAYFENCLIVSNRSNSDITAASTDENWKFGYVFSDSKLDGLPAVSGVTMGRPWKPFSQTVFMNSELGDHMHADGWSEWGGNNNHETAFYAVYNNTGPGSQPDSYLDWTHVLSQSEASKYTIENIFSKDVRPDPFASDWLPALDDHAVYQEVAQSAVNLFEDTLYYLPLIESVSYQGKPVEDYDPKHSLYTVTIHEDNINKDEIDVATMDPEATVDIQLPNSIPGNATVIITARSGSTSNYLIKFWYEPLALASSGNSLEVYPNPFENEINWQFSNIREQEARVSIFNLSGAKVLDKVISSEQMRSGIYISDATAISRGIYTYQVEINGELISGKLIKK